VELDADGNAPAGDCYDAATGLKVFIGMVALLPQNASQPVVISPASTMAGIGAIIGVSEAVRQLLHQLRRDRSLVLAAHACSRVNQDVLWTLL
jgi:hypothetical protein